MTDSLYTEDFLFEPLSGRLYTKDFRFAIEPLPDRLYTLSIFYLNLCQTGCTLGTSYLNLCQTGNENPQIAPCLPDYTEDFLFEPLLDKLSTEGFLSVRQAVHWGLSI